MISERMRGEVLAALRRLRPEATFSLDADPNNIRMEQAGQDVHFFQMTNVPRRLSSGWSAEAVARDWLASMQDLQTGRKDWEGVRGRLLLQLRTPTTIRLPDTIPPEWNIDRGEARRRHRPIALESDLTGLTLQLVIDNPNSLTLVVEAMVERWGVDRGRMAEIARENTLRVLPTWMGGRFKGRRFWQATNQSAVACSSLLPEHVAKLDVRPGRLWVAAPHRDLAIAYESSGDDPMEDPMLVPFALLVLDRYRTKHHPISPYLYRRVDGDVHVLGVEPV